MKQAIFSLVDIPCEERVLLYGPQDQYLHTWEQVFHVFLFEEEEQLWAEGESDSFRKVSRTVSYLYSLIQEKKPFDEVDVRKIADHFFTEEEDMDTHSKAVGRSYDHRLVYPLTKGQKQLVECLETKDMTFVSGPAGTGKTFLSVVYAVTKLHNEEVNRLIITRPVVEAGENLGFLPGDLKEKVDPYLRPIYDALSYMLGQQKMEKLIEKGTIEIAPLAYMRGRTLDDAIIILDEAQNTTRMQMKMFLTRMGFHSQMIITGDPTQIDLPKPKDSGFMDAINRLENIEEIGFVYLDGTDVVRHPLVKKILESYRDESCK